jgi:hypothetical protein
MRTKIIMAGLDPLISPFVIPANAGIQLHVFGPSWTLTFVRVTM